MGVCLLAGTVTCMSMLCFLSHICTVTLSLTRLLPQPCNLCFVLINELLSFVLPEFYNFLGFGLAESALGIIDGMMQFEIELVESFIEIQRYQFGLRRDGL